MCHFKFLRQLDCGRIVVLCLVCEKNFLKLIKEKSSSTQSCVPRDVQDSELRFSHLVSALNEDQSKYVTDSRKEAQEIWIGHARPKLVVQSDPFVVQGLNLKSEDSSARNGLNRPVSSYNSAPSFNVQEFEFSQLSAPPSQFWNECSQDASDQNDSDARSSVKILCSLRPSRLRRQAHLFYSTHKNSHICPHHDSLSRR